MFPVRNLCKMKQRERHSDIVTRFLEELMHDKRFCYVKNGVYNAQKAFIISSVLKYCIRRRSSGHMSEAETIRNFKILNKFLDEKIEIKWQNGKFNIIVDGIVKGFVS